MIDITDAFDSVVDDAFMWITDNASGFFDFVRSILEGMFNGLEVLFVMTPYWAFIAVVFIAGWLFVGKLFAVSAALGLWLCQAMGLWADTMATLTLVLTSTVIALLIGIPAGILVGLTEGLNKVSDLVLDFIQTMPAYIYLLPGIALVGYGPATAMCATSLVAIPPAMRLSAHGIRMTPVQFRELGQAVGMKPAQALFKIRIPFAFPSILAGVNQSLMLGFGMVVIAGIVGSGGLGQTVYEAVRTLQIDKSVNAGIAIVVLSIILDRFSQRLANLRTGGAHG
ncbi:ABC transporter permease subunit [Sinorhizobium meliloti]|uniref:ABC transporter permease n=1 Tax=Rhizobium meliloti TaxID=382 RepID=UPI000FD9A4A0|nr:ABC transporter permease subunit [Sinorhizobium meliloti]RVI99544.1 ABC transporter permease subunit [Sinorhizobium meliloti]